MSRVCIRVRSTFVLPTLLVLMACHPSPEPTPGDSGNSVDPQPDPVVEPDQGEPVATKGDVELSPLNGKDVAVTVGTTLRYSFKSHASVGYGASQSVGDAAVVRYLRTDEAYQQSEEQRAGKPGSDAATGTFVFEAVGVGTTTLQVDEQFRGTVETSTTFTITVSAK